LPESPTSRVIAGIGKQEIFNHKGTEGDREIQKHHHGFTLMTFIMSFCTLGLAGSLKRQ
jgi:hypothetical protein